MRAFVAFVTRINLRHWTQHRLRTSLTLLGVTVGVMLVVAVASVNGTLLGAVEDTARRLGADAELEIAAADRTGLAAKYVVRTAGLEGVRTAVPVMRSYARAEGGAGETRMLVLGVTPDFQALLQGFSPDELSIGGTAEMHEEGIYLASVTAERLGVEVGDPVRIETARGLQEVGVSGLFSGDSVDALGAGDVAVMGLPSAQRLFDRVGSVDSVYVMTDPGIEPDELHASLEEVLPTGTIIGPPGQRAQGFDEALNGIAALSSLAGTVALFVAAFVVFNSVAMSVGERRREISLSLALGATRKQVLAGFVGEALVLGGVACALGLAGGYFLAQELIEPGLDGLRVFSITAVADPAFGWPQILLGVIAGLGVSVAASYLPARRIMQVAPVESLRPAAPYGTSGDPKRSVARLVGFIVGIVVIVLAVAFGLMVDSNLENAAWTTSVALVFLLGGVTLLLPSIVPVLVRSLRSIFKGSVAARLGLDSLGRNPRRTTITVGALVFTLGIVVGVGGALDSYEAQWKRSATEWYAGPIQVVPNSYGTLGADQPLSVDLGSVLEDVPGVEGVYPVRFRVTYVDGRQTAIYALSYEGSNRHPTVRASGGQEFRDWVASIQDEGEVVVSAQTARKKGVQVGDEVVLPTPTGDVAFKVGGVMHDLNPLDSVFMGAEMFTAYWLDQRVDSFTIAPEEGVSGSEVMANLQAVMDQAGIPATVMTKDELIASIFAPIDELFSVARAIQLAALLVAALAIANTMFVTVLERRWELGLQKAVGMDARSVVKMLLVEAAAIGVVGSVLAWAAGLGMGHLMVADMERAYSFSFPFEVPLDLMVITLAMGSAIALAAGAYPSRRALKVPIVESLRFE